MQQNQLVQHGAKPQKDPKWTPIFIDRAFTGIFTQRNVLHDPSDFWTKNYGGRPDALWMGKNVELTNRLTLQRRPGLSQFSTFSYPSVPLRGFSFQLANGNIQVIIDTGSTGALAISAAANASGGTTAYTGTFPAGGSNAYAGWFFQVSGFVTNLINNGIYKCTASTTTTLTLANAGGIAETHAATATSAGAVYVDNQNGSATLLFGKSVGAGQTYFVAVGGVLYMGDGVDVKKYTPGNPNGTVWAWGSNGPSTAPAVVVTPAASANVNWTASTWYSTMGIVFDSGTTSAQLLTVVNNAGSQIGTSGSGQPTWNNTLAGTTTDNTVTWECAGQVQPWAPNKGFASYSAIGTGGFPSFCYVAATGCIYGSAQSATAGTTSASTNPANFPTTPGAFYRGDGTVDWVCVGSYNNNLKTNNIWKPGTSYQAPPNAAIIFEPFIPPQSAGQPLSSTPMFAQVSQTTGTSNTFASPFANAANAGIPSADNQLTWISLGSSAWSAGRTVTAWTSPTNYNFTAIKDSNGNIQVCITGGVTQSPSHPTWATFYGHQTTESTGVVWVCCGSALGAVWTASQQFYLPVGGFAPPQASDPYGGASIIDTNTDAEFVVNTGVSGTPTHPTWNSIGGYTADNTSANNTFVITSVTVAGGSTTYTGTVTGGGANAYAGKSFVFTGFGAPGNNVAATATASTATTIVVATTSQITSTTGGNAYMGNLVWFNLEAQPTNTFTYTKGHYYAYSWKARSLTDFYSVAVNGIIPTPPGDSAPLPPPAGSETGLITTASPTANVGVPSGQVVNTIYGNYSSDPQIDTIVIWRDADGGGPSNMFELTEIPNIPANAGIGTYIINGVHYDWAFNDFLPDVATGTFPGLNPLIPAPINGSNNPPPSNFLPQVYNFTRIWGINGQNVQFSGGPDVITGNKNEAFLSSNSLPFLANVLRVVKSSGGLVTFLTDSIELIAGGPATVSFYSATLIPGCGLANYNALDQYAGEIYFFSSDNRCLVLSPSLNLSNFGFPLGDQFANLPSSGVSDTTWTPANVYMSILQNGTDNAIFVADGSTGWYRVNPHQVPGGAQGPEPIWSPFAAITGGCQMVQTVETAPGIRKLLVGGTGAGSILYRNQSIFTDNGTQYDANFVMGSIVLAHPGQHAIIGFLEFDFSGVSYQPTVSYLLDEISGAFTAFSASPVFDPPQIYGTTITPATYSPNRYYFKGQNSLARTRHFQIKVDFGTTSNGDELFDMTIYGKLVVEG